MYESDLVSVVIPTRGRTGTLRRSVESVLKQTHSFVEVIVVNDNDKDSPFNQQVKSVVDSFCDPRVKFLLQNKHINGAAARNCGINAARGEYISFLDDDDWWDDVKIEHQLALLKTQDNSVGAVSCLKKYYSHNKLSSISLPYKDGFICKEVISRCIGIGIGSLLIRRSALDETGYFDESLTRMQDIQLFGFLCFKYKIVLLKEHLYSIDIDDSQNRSGGSKVIKIKEDFLRAISPILNKMPQKDAKFVRIMSDFEIGYSLIKDHAYLSGISYVFPIFTQRDTFIFACKRIFYKVRIRLMLNYFIKRYGLKSS